MDNFVLFAQLLKGLNRQGVKCSKGGSGSEGAWWENVDLDSDLLPKMSCISIPLHWKCQGTRNLLSKVNSAFINNYFRTALREQNSTMWSRKKPVRNSGLSESSASIPTVTLDVKNQHPEMQGRCSHKVMVRGVMQGRKKSCAPNNSSNSRAWPLLGTGRWWDGQSCAPGAGEGLSLAQMTSSTHEGNIQGAHVLLISSRGRDVDPILQMGKQRSRTRGCTFFLPNMGLHFFLWA